MPHPRPWLISAPSSQFPRDGVLCFLFDCSLRQSIRDHEPSPTSGEAESTVYVDVDRMDIGGTSISLYDFAGQVWVDEEAPSHRDVGGHGRSSSGRVLVRVRTGPWQKYFRFGDGRKNDDPIRGRSELHVTHLIGLHNPIGIRRAALLRQLRCFKFQVLCGPSRVCARVLHLSNIVSKY